MTPLDIMKAQEKYLENKKITGWSTNLKGVGYHWLDGVKWALKQIPEVANDGNK